jgi:hypothetical protein
MHGVQAPQQWNCMHQAMAEVVAEVTQHKQHQQLGSCRPCGDVSAHPARDHPVGDHPERWCDGGKYRHQDAAIAYCVSQVSECSPAVSAAHMKRDQHLDAGCDQGGDGQASEKAGSGGDRDPDDRHLTTALATAAPTGTNGASRFGRA